jgi:hypothetical protein
MTRTLRLFKEQMMKAGISPPTQSTRNNGLDLENLEVVKYFEIFIIQHTCINNARTTM